MASSGRNDRLRLTAQDGSISDSNRNTNMTTLRVDARFGSSFVPNTYQIRIANQIIMIFPQKDGCGGCWRLKEVGCLTPHTFRQLPSLEDLLPSLSYIMPQSPHNSILLGLLVLVLVAVQCYSLSAPLIQVCQNKDCCKRYQGRIDLYQTIQDLNLDAKVESSGCLSHCGQGPNIEIDGQVVHEITNAATAAVQLELTLGKAVPKLLLAAVQVLEKANGR